MLRRFTATLAIALFTAVALEGIPEPPVVAESPEANFEMFQPVHADVASAAGAVHAEAIESATIEALSAVPDTPEVVSTEPGSTRLLLDDTSLERSTDARFMDPMSPRYEWRSPLPRST